MSVRVAVAATGGLAVGTSVELPAEVDLVLGCAGLGSLVGTAAALALAARSPDVEEWRVIGAATVGGGLFGLGIAVIGALL